MSDSQIAKIIMASNNLKTASDLLANAINEGGDLSDKIAAVNEMIKNCEEELRKIQFNR